MAHTTSSIRVPLLGILRNVHKCDSNDILSVLSPITGETTDKINIYVASLSYNLDHAKEYIAFIKELLEQNKGEGSILPFVNIELSKWQPKDGNIEAWCIMNYPEESGQFTRDYDKTIMFYHRGIVLDAYCREAQYQGKYYDPNFKARYSQNCSIISRYRTPINYDCIPHSNSQISYAKYLDDIYPAIINFCYEKIHNPNIQLGAWKIDNKLVVQPISVTSNKELEMQYCKLLNDYTIECGIRACLIITPLNWETQKKRKLCYKTYPLPNIYKSISTRSEVPRVIISTIQR